VYGIIQPGPHVPDGVPFLRPADIKDSKVVLGDLPRTSQKIAPDYRRAALEPGDVVFSIVGTIGKWIIAGEELRGANITQSSVRLRPAFPLTPWFFVYVLSCPVVSGQISKLMFGNAVQRLNVDHVRKLVVPLPPTAEWTVLEAQVSTALERVRRLGDASVATENELRSLDQSILAKAFRGELVPQDPNDEPAETLLARIQAETRPPNTQKGGRVRRS
jgi:type I restriction enzyme S subunit